MKLSSKRVLAVAVSILAIPVYAMVKSKKAKTSFKAEFVSLLKKIGAELAVYGGIVAVLAVKFWKWLVPAVKTLCKWIAIGAKWLWKYISIAAKWLWKYLSIAFAFVARLWHKVFPAKEMPVFVDQAHGGYALTNLEASILPTEITKGKYDKNMSCYTMP